MSELIWRFITDELKNIGITEIVHFPKGILLFYYTWMSFFYKNFSVF